MRCSQVVGSRLICLSICPSNETFVQVTRGQSDMIAFRTFRIIKLQLYIARKSYPKDELLARDDRVVYEGG